jgi:hypothetical protein
MVEMPPKDKLDEEWRKVINVLIELHTKYQVGEGRRKGRDWLIKIPAESDMSN